MAIPAFTAFGLLPAGVHDCTLPEAEACLCGNQHRINIWDGFRAFLGWTAALPLPAAYLLDGSYVSDKANPNDIDVVVDITTCGAAEQNAWIAAWAANIAHAKANFHVDFYPFVIGIGNDFSAFFQYVRIEDALRRGVPPTTRKGILRVVP